MFLLLYIICIRLYRDVKLFYVFFLHECFVFIQNARQIIIRLITFNCVMLAMLFCMVLKENRVKQRMQISQMILVLKLNLVAIVTCS